MDLYNLEYKEQQKNMTYKEEYEKFITQYGFNHQG
jgi:hypothetical protein